MKTVHHLSEEEVKLAVETWLKARNKKKYSIELKVERSEKPPIGGHRGGQSESIVIETIVAIATENSDYLD